MLFLLSSFYCSWNSPLLWISLSEAIIKISYLKNSQMPLLIITLVSICHSSSIKNLLSIIETIARTVSLTTKLKNFCNYIFLVSFDEPSVYNVLDYQLTTDSWFHVVVECLGAKIKQWSNFKNFLFYILHGSDLKGNIS